MSLLSPKQRAQSIGVAFSGGGARGFAHAGALKALEELGIKPSIVAGVSAGAVIAALYSAGVKPEAMIDVFAEVKFSTSCELALRGGGLFKIDRFIKFLETQLRGFKNIEDLPIPTHICATDFDNDRPVVFTKGKIAQRVGASCSIPILFKPMMIDGVNYVDGGVLRNLPAWAIREHCDKLIGINCSPMGDQEPHVGSIIDVAQHAYNLMSKQNVKVDAAMCDLVVETRDIAHYRVFNMKEINKVYSSGYAAMMQAARSTDWLPDPQQ
ncbi:MAG: patatin-like phospholipase family protein [Muribaculaceae bacterium]|nr:patatin-like phospholipase family protein [Muribaculaceae bacterium]